METSRSEITDLLSRQKAYFADQKTKDLSFRIEQLVKLKAAIKKHEGKITEALALDLHKSELEAYSTEIGILYEEINFTLKRLKGWAKPERVRTALTHTGSKGFVIKEPFGSVLIIAPWNYPFQLALSPLVGAIAAGNTAVIKPSELTPNVSALIKDLLGEIYTDSFIATVEGGVPTSEALLEQPFDYIFFTGSVPVGKIVMEAASKHLTPVTLELGGKSPVIVHKDANITLAAKRIVFGKFTNAGQTCIAPDYLLVHKEVKQELQEAMQEAVLEFYGENPLESTRYSKIVSKRHYDRLTGYLSDGKILFGGNRSDEDHRIEPTFLDSPDPASPVMNEEIFGPIFPVLEFTELEEAITFINGRPKPLALYLFTESREIEKEVLGRVSFGGGCVNDTLMHIATPYLPFGGVGESGMGNYHGKYSFDTFSHSKSVLKQTSRFDFSFRYPSAKNGLKLIRKLLK
ncbi:aldehyde dehydrogenase family protein [Bacillus mangrovi]|uniref:Aldehyde dehydrogenase n=1 Tax=Metabacillus mangrovi TaxID=1491830 RepID=A0A7X2V625_9BACI|nr:aldehyde dehydrogenase [Metabacillus mangrovi]MTH54658.1 aldehyde dehydrogenase family protein [Metabacillus mangrovi]